MPEASHLPHKEPVAPSASTMKRLFARSGNRCAFPKCAVAIVQGETIVGEICHIKARSKEGPRYDRSQTPEERHDYDNLILMCGNHHTVIDDDPDAYTVDRLLRMKRDHESVTTEMSAQLLDAGTRLLVALALTSVNQSGGITAHTVNIGTPGLTGPRLGSRIRIDRLGEREHVRFSLVTTL